VRNSELLNYLAPRWLTTTSMLEQTCAWNEIWRSRFERELLWCVRVSGVASGPRVAPCSLQIHFWKDFKCSSFSILFLNKFFETFKSSHSCQFLCLEALDCRLAWKKHDRWLWSKQIDETFIQKSVSNPMCWSAPVSVLKAGIF